MVTDEPTTQTRAAVVPFPVRTVAPPPAPTPMSKDLLASLASRELAGSIHDADRFIGQAVEDEPLADVSPVAYEAVLDRSAIVINLGDVVKRRVADEKAALVLLREIDRGLRAGTIPTHSPLAKLDLTSARAVAKFALAGGLEFLAGRRP